MVETAALFEALTAGLPVDDADLDGEQRARRLLAHLLEFHRREDKSIWWEFFHRCGFTEEEHVESRATLGALTYDGEVEQVKRSVVHRYRFPEQPHKIEVRDSPKNPDTGNPMSSSGEFTGISDPYEAPGDAEITLDTAELTAEEAAQKIVLHLEKEGYVSGEPADPRS